MNPADQDTEALDSLMITCVDAIFAMLAAAFFGVAGIVALAIGGYL